MVRGGRTYFASCTLPTRRCRSVNWSKVAPRAGLIVLEAKTDVRCGFLGLSITTDQFWRFGFCS